MDLNTAGFGIIIVFSVIAVAAFITYRLRSNIKIRGPFGTGIDIDASNEPRDSKFGVRIKKAKSTGGGVYAEDGTGRGADLEDIEAKDDIIATSKTDEGK